MIYWDLSSWETPEHYRVEQGFLTLGSRSEYVSTCHLECVVMKLKDHQKEATGPLACHSWPFPDDGGGH